MTGERRSLRKISAELAELGYLSGPFNPKSLKRMLSSEDRPRSIRDRFRHPGASGTRPAATASRTCMATARGRAALPDASRRPKLAP
jgi:hypothetical protein